MVGCHHGQFEVSRNLLVASGQNHTNSQKDPFQGRDLKPNPAEYKIQNHELWSNFTFTITPCKK